MMRDVFQDLRYSLRSLARTPGFAMLAILMLALGIGANSAIFSVINGVILKPLGYPEPDQLVMITSQFPGTRLRQVLGCLRPNTSSSVSVRSRSARSAHTVRTRST